VVFANKVNGTPLAYDGCPSDWPLKNDGAVHQEGVLKKFHVDSRFVMASALGVAAALGCSTQISVNDPPPSPPGPPGPSTQAQFGGIATQAETAPPPVSGGSLLTLVQSDGTAIAIAGDQEEDSLYVVALGNSPGVLGTLNLQTGDMPGRMVADAEGRVHVVLRGGGGIATIMPTATGASLISRRAVCSAPRGIDYDPSNDSVYVACATGELVSLPAAGGPATLSADLGRDLRDVVVTSSGIFVSRFRIAEVVEVDHSFNLMPNSIEPGSLSTDSAGTPEVAWRMVRESASSVRMIYQVASNSPIDVATPPNVSSYGSNDNDQQPVNGSGGGVVSVESASLDGTSVNAQPLASNPVVDIAVSPYGWEAISITGTVEQESGQQTALAPDGDIAENPDTFVSIADAQTTAVPQVVVQRRGLNPGLIVINTDSGQLTPTMVTVPFKQKQSHVDTGFDIFHVPTGGGIACMNCHPEGGDDSHTWQFQLQDETRARRTQVIRGGVVENTAPYHWDGDMNDMQMLCNEVFTHRMGGGQVSAQQLSVLGHFISSMPRMPVKLGLDATKIAAGKTVFDNSGCQGCHVGYTGTLQQNQNIGKTDSLSSISSKALQVPILVDVADRAPYMHDGCAPTLEDRLTVSACSGFQHGNVSAMSTDDKTNLIEFLQTL
jgi:hypothetical protein